MATNKKRTEDVLRQAEGWRKGIRFLGGTSMKDYRPDEA